MADSTDFLTVTRVARVARFCPARLSKLICSCGDVKHRMRIASFSTSRPPLLHRPYSNLSPFVLSHIFHSTLKFRHNLILITSAVNCPRRSLPVRGLLTNHVSLFLCESSPLSDHEITGRPLKTSISIFRNRQGDADLQRAVLDGNQAAAVIPSRWIAVRSLRHNGAEPRKATKSRSSPEIPESYNSTVLNKKTTTALQRHSRFGTV